MSPRYAIATLVGLLTATAAAAASCPAHNCFCSGGAGSTGGTVEAEVSSIDGPRTNFLVSTPLGDVGGLDAGDTLTLPRTRDDAVGTRWLLELSGQLVYQRYTVEADGGVPCPGSSPLLVVSVATAEDLASSPDCPQKLQSLGFRPTPCGVTGPLSGCSSGAAGSPIALFALLLFLRRGAPKTRFALER